MDKRGYAGDTLRAQATILIHETAQQITVLGFQVARISLECEVKQWTVHRSLIPEDAFQTAKNHQVDHYC